MGIGHVSSRDVRNLKGKIIMKLQTLGTCAALSAALFAVAGCDRAGRDDMAANGTQYPRNVDQPASAQTPTTPMGQVAQAGDDTATTAKVKAALAADSSVNGSNVSVETNSGKVILTGALPPAQIERAVQIARGVDGVRDVDNRLAATG
jgi:hyperosmotically inducible protein